VIMLTAHGEKEDVELARDAGVTEYVVKPFTAKTLFDRIVWLVENPRSFIFSKGYVGPERRRHGRPPDGVADRRVPEKEVKPLVITKDQLKNIKDLETDRPISVLPDYEIKKKIGPGADIHQIVSEPVLHHSQDIIHSARDEFYDLFIDDMNRLRHTLAALRKEPANAAQHLAAIRDIALTIKARTGTVGYTRASDVAKLLSHFTTKPVTDLEHHRIIISKHIETLDVIFTHHMIGDGGSHGQELVDELGRLIHKYFP
jgi:CheY-like chemotaxis protein